LIEGANIAGHDLFFLSTHAAELRRAERPELVPVLARARSVIASTLPLAV
jgi:hypothetical protein